MVFSSETSCVVGKKAQPGFCWTHMLDLKGDGHSDTNANNKPFHLAII